MTVKEAGEIFGLVVDSIYSKIDNNERNINTKKQKKYKKHKQIKNVKK